MRYTHASILVLFTRFIQKTANDFYKVFAVFFFLELTDTTDFSERFYGSRLCRG